MKTLPCVLTIAGSDSGGGAGIQADQKGISARGVHAATAITAVTAQNSRSVPAVHPLPAEIVEAQIDAVMTDMKPSTLKIGMLGTSELARLVANKIREWRPEAVVLDPVMIASSGARLIEEDAISALRDELLPLATIVTPNWPEAETLLDRAIEGLDGLSSAGQSMAALGCDATLFKGGHLEGESVVDVLWNRGTVSRFENPRLSGAEGHGTGCTLASAIAAGLAKGEPLAEACRRAIEIVQRALSERYRVGSSKPVFLATLDS
ncbi:MAG: bifunctional hydroxymethylpyrimidine kinase/phosphomethylpyrimidine kinase [Thermoanaerobaculia bacterium]|nr:bifunctional hydroxymethylpyrimidine kinase/phosphomethylpyrimidine kinase [Thermoanaerobaculia bacterium]